VSDHGRIVAHIPGLRRYARMLAGDSHRADDLVQETLLRACAKWSLWKPSPKLRQWLFTIMHNVFINQLKAAPPPAQSLDSIEGFEPSMPAPDVGMAIDLERALAQLPGEQREVLLMVAVEDFSYEEVARVTGVPIGTVMSRLSRARRRLHALMEIDEVRDEAREDVRDEARDDPQEGRSRLKVMK
jgi:RNA polymerase sigma factor (sigma-70 family)